MYSILFSVIKWKESALSKLTRHNRKLSVYCLTVMKPQYFHSLRYSNIAILFLQNVCILRNGFTINVPLTKHDRNTNVPDIRK